MVDDVILMTLELSFIIVILMILESPFTIVILMTLESSFTIIIMMTFYFIIYDCHSDDLRVIIYDHHLRSSF